MPSQSTVVKIIDEGYGDSDVSLVHEGEGSRFVRKTYRSERMRSNLRQQILLQGHQLLVLNIDSRLRGFLLGISSDDFRDFYLPAILDRYRQDTLDVLEDVEGNKDFYAQRSGVPGIGRIEFQVLAQGNRRFVDGGCSVVDGQTLCEGKNLEQVMGVCEAQRRDAPSSELQANLPAVFAQKAFIDRVLVPFHQEFLKRLVSRATGGPNPRQFPVFHRLHPANVIPQRISENAWRFIITDLSGSLGLDYALIMKELERTR